MDSLLSLNFTSFFFIFLFLLSFSSARTQSSSSSSIHINSSISEFYGQTTLSDFRLLNRRSLQSCNSPNPYLEISIDSVSNFGLANNQNVTVTVSGVLVPAASDWIGMISPSTSNVSGCPQDAIMYLQTGDIESLPFLCHYPVKAQYMTKDPYYLSCSKSTCQKYSGGSCAVKTCSGSLTFNVINIRTDIEFVLFGNGFVTPCILKRANPVSFANPNSPLYGHLSSVDSTGKSLRLTWVSGDPKPQQVQFGNGKYATSIVTTFTQNDMCGSVPLTPAKDYGWHDPGYIHTAVMTGLQPSTHYFYRYGSDSVGWSDNIQFWTPPAGGSAAIKFLAFGDMGKAPFDDSVEHYINPGSKLTSHAMALEVASAGNVDSIFHVGDISYATGFLVEWDFFLSLIAPMASHVSYMTAIGNHERDYPFTGSYGATDSGGECGVPYETYFPMPTIAKDKPWYSIEQGPIHFTVMSTEHNWTKGSEQYEWMEADMASVDRSRTPWLIFVGHRPLYSSNYLDSVNPQYVAEVEPLLLEYKVDLAICGHVHNYERTCAVYQGVCQAMPTIVNGVDTYNNTYYKAPVYVVMGMAGFILDEFPPTAVLNKWSLVRLSEFGYTKFQVTVEEISVQMVNATTMTVQDSFRFIKAKTAGLL